MAKAALNTRYSTRYSRLSMLLHWLSALLVLGLFGSGLWQVQLTYYDSLYKTLPHYHKSFGLMLFALTFVRLLVRWCSPAVVSVPGLSPRALQAVRVGHVALYVLLFMVIACGFGISTADGHPITLFNWFSVPALPWRFDQQEVVLGEWHEWGAYTLIALVSGHVVLSLTHGKAVLRRMLPWW